MSRLGKQPIQIPSGVKASVTAGLLKVEGPKGKLDLKIPSGVDLVLEQTKISVNRKSDEAANRAKHGLVRTLIANIVTGVTSGYERKLEIVGVGYRAAVKGKTLNLTLGFSHPVDFPIPEGLTVKVEGNTGLVLQSPDKALLGETAAKIRALRPPEPYQGKGIKYSNEVIRRKAGKAAAGGK
ncbi:MAG: 50S ribosomal protein L6 [Bdellovibrionales bacterium]|nr:50S ribosomal protein L6 [Bdellovibrionales bacterium]